ncbi:hypothetical protein CC80DRAFT_471241 [Byssothecium circinans]|uniref:Pali-domain-containing protein n=1 Tax=Byssothecium circinans TaxID=147558 RepID=A0A6A5TWX2_9PLEO|nr:hypothetical protein CC80DRAFT_471241 [Byssothecium circinans]
MTRRAVYSAGLLLTVACTVMTIASIIIPRWASLSTDDGRKFSMGLHKYYKSPDDTYVPFPKDSDCLKDENFCHMWRTVGFLITFDVAVEFCTLVAFIVMLAGGVQRRVAGWQIACALLLLSGFVQCVGMAIVAYLFDHDEHFFEGWYLDASWFLCTVSWALLFATSLGLALSALYLPPEGDYELIPDDSEVVHDEQLLSRIGAWNDNVRKHGSYQDDRDW